MAEKKQTSGQATETQVVTTSAGNVHIIQPGGPKHRRKPKVTVLVGNTDDVVREQFGGFVNFLREYAVVGLAIGFIVGQQAQAVIKQLVASFIDPLISLVFNGTKLSTSTFHLHWGGRTEAFSWGAFVYTLIDFLFILAAIYAMIKLFKLDKFAKKK